MRMTIAAGSARQRATTTGPMPAPCPTAGPVVTTLRAALLAALLLLPSPVLAHGAADADGASFDLLVGALILASALAYLVVLRDGVRTRRRRLVSPLRAMAFLAGCGVFFAVLASPLHGLADLRLSAHMVQHVVLVTVAPLLVLAGRPDVMILVALPRRRRSAPARIARSALRSPLVAAAAHGVAMWGWHAPPAFDAALQSEVLHGLEHFSFVATALWFWAAVIAATRRSSGRIDALFAVLATLVHSGILGAFLAFAGRPLYPAYADEAALLGYEALADQQLAGLIMWVPGGVFYLAAALWIAFKLLGPDTPPYSAAPSGSV